MKLFNEIEAIFLRNVLLCHFQFMAQTISSLLQAQETAGVEEEKKVCINQRKSNHLCT